MKTGKLLDICVVLFFLSTAAFSLNLFRLDLMQTLDSRDEDPAGTIIIRNNVVQRRYADRVLWDRLFVDSPVYSGDLIRAADHSDATVIIENNGLDLNENTLIRIQFAPNGRGPFQVELKEGNLGVTTGTEGLPLMLSLAGGIEVQPGPGTVLNAISGGDGIEIQVNEGAAKLTRGGSIRELVEGMMMAQDSSGVERIVPAVVVKAPIQNARYLKEEAEPVPVDFVWNRVNLEAGESLSLEISGDRNFIRDLQVYEGLDDKAQALFEPGLWFWRITYRNVVLRAGQLSVADASGPSLKSPVVDSVFRYNDVFPTLRFQWSEKPDASHYLLEVSDAEGFTNPKITRKVAAASYICSDLGPGTWYWRVQPVFPSVYEGTAVYSPTGSFRIEQSSDPKAPPIELPEPAPAALSPVAIPVRSDPVLPAVAQPLVPVRPDPVPPAIPQALVPVQQGRADAGRAGTGRAVAGQNYTIQAGDTLGEISIQAYGRASGWLIIARANNIENPDLIYSGDVIFIPVGD